MVVSEEEKFKATRPNFGNTISNLVNHEKEEVEDLQIWQHHLASGDVQLCHSEYRKSILK